MFYYTIYDCVIIENPQLIPAFCLITCEWTEKTVCILYIGVASPRQTKQYLLWFQ